MKYRLFAASAAVLSFLPIAPSYARLTAAESGRVGNGGHAYVCRDASGAITSARLLDLWEAEGVPTWSKDDSVEAQIAAALAKLRSYSPNTAYYVSDHLQPFVDSAVFSERTLTVTEDAFPSYQPAPGCRYEQVARYEPVVGETGLSGLRIASEIYHSPFFSNTDRAALFVHEAVYQLDRDQNGAKDSQRSRMVIAHLFSDSVIPDAVRLASAALLGTQLRPLYGEGSPIHGNGKDKRVRRNIISVPNPKEIAFRVQFGTVDGIDSKTIASMDSARRNAKYRCNTQANVFGENARKATTGWIKLSDLVKYDLNMGANDDAINVQGSFEGGEFVIGKPIRGRFENFFRISCERKDQSGRVKAVPHGSTIVTLPEAKALYVDESDRSMHVHGNPARLKTLGSIFISHPEDGESTYTDAFEAEIVLAAPATAAVK